MLEIPQQDAHQFFEFAILPTFLRYMGQHELARSKHIAPARLERHGLDEQIFVERPGLKRGAVETHAPDSAALGEVDLALASCRLPEFQAVLHDLNEDRPESALAFSDGLKFDDGGLRAFGLRCRQGKVGSDAVDRAEHTANRKGILPDVTVDGRLDDESEAAAVAAVELEDIETGGVAAKAEVAHGGGVDPKDTVLMAWENQKVGIELAEEGYDVVITPGQAYYLDMVQAEDWLKPGASWAGTAPPHRTYSYEAEGDFPEALKSRFKGIQACIWSENIISRAYLNHLVFPRLNAIAEAAWTPTTRKDWERFAAISRLSPILCAARARAMGRWRSGMNGSFPARLVLGIRQAPGVGQTIEDGE